MFRNNNPDKGTETVYDFICDRGWYSLEIITPIRGRKQFEAMREFKELCLEIITPIRGRKLFNISNSLFVRKFRNNNPDKGTETLLIKC